MPHSRRRGSRGFTISELLLVFTIVALISLIAYPSMRTFMGANEDASAATRLTRTFNLVQDQAKRRNRAHLIELSLFQRDLPAGRMDVLESASTSCVRTAEDADDEDLLTELEALPFGGTVIEDYIGPVEDEAGLSGWALAGDDEQRERLRLCIAPDGSVSRVLGGTAIPLGGTLEVRVQRFQLDQGGFARVGPPRRVEITFAGGARMRVN